MSTDISMEPSPDRPTVDRILAAAAELFVARNYADVTVDQVAEAADLTKGAVYHHFRNKEGLYLAMLHGDLARTRERLEGAVAGGGTTQARLRALTGAFLALPPVERRLIQLIRRDANRFDPPVRAELVRAYQAALPDVVERVVREGVRAGELVPTDARLLAWQFVALVEVLLTPYAERRFESDDDKLDYAMSLFFLGCARDRGPGMEGADR